MYLIELKSPAIFRKFTESENQPRIFLKFTEKCFMGMTFILYSINFHKLFWDYPDNIPKILIEFHCFI